MQTCPQSPWSKSLLLGSSHFLFGYLLQIENYFSFIQQPTDGVLGAIWFLARLPFFQIEHIFVALLLAGFCRILFAMGKLGVFLAVSTTLLMNLYLVVDQVGFSLFFDHLQLRFAEGQLGTLSSHLDSFLRELLPISYVNLFLLVILQVLILKIIFNKTEPRFKFRPNLPAGLVLAAFFSISLWIWYTQSNHHLERHPLVAIISGFIPQESAKPLNDAIVPNYDRSVLHQGFEKADRVPPAPSGHSQANIVFIIMESVGSKQIFPHEDGHVDPVVTPNLAKMSSHMIVFDAVYSVFPASVRSHVAMNTGGNVITWGSVYEELNHHYNAPTLNSFMHEHGYLTALVSAGYLDVENIGTFYKNLGYDYYFDPTEAPKEVIAEQEINSWGLNEQFVMQKAIHWIDMAMEKKKPFFLQFLTHSTHHPYSIPVGFKAPFPASTSDKQDYLNAIFYGDSVIGELIDELKNRGLLDNTIICLTGDHGESFEEWHAGNLLHKTRLYEENIRSFFAVIDPKSIQSHFVSRRIGSVGDILPTIASMVDATDKNLPGVDLFAKDFPERMVFFHKNLLPEQWGLRDGKWKFIENKVGDREAQLFDLEKDPHEQINLIKSFPDLGNRYTQRVNSWYVSVNQSFTAKLEGFDEIGGVSLDSIDVTTPGPKIVAIGYKSPDGEFHELDQLQPKANLSAMILFVADKIERDYIAEWISPSGVHTEETHHIIPDWTTYSTNNQMKLPLEEGTWTFLWKDEIDEKIILKRKFIISND